MDWRGTRPRCNCDEACRGARSCVAVARASTPAAAVRLPIMNVVKCVCICVSVCLWCTWLLLGAPGAPSFLCLTSVLCAAIRSSLFLPSHPSLTTVNQHKTLLSEATQLSHMSNWAMCRYVPRQLTIVHPSLACVAAIPLSHKIVTQLITTSGEACAAFRHSACLWQSGTVRLQQARKEPSVTAIPLGAHVQLSAPCRCRPLSTCLR